MAQAQGARLHGLRTPAPCAVREPPRSRTRARALPDGRSSRFEELFVDDGAAAAKRGAATKKTAPATQPPPPAASVLAEAPPPLDSKGTAAVGVQAAVAFFAVGLVWQLWPLIKLCVTAAASRAAPTRVACGALTRARDAGAGAAASGGGGFRVSGAQGPGLRRMRRPVLARRRRRRWARACPALAT